jgi:hypothetical protein|tara:strand:- start:1193 stop:1570 length:378 start_codon:yes stop_codon:yes gene_type:complete
MNIDKLKKIHQDTTTTCLDIMVKKNSDYTGGKGASDVFANFNASVFIDVHPVSGLLMRLMDKVQRVRSFVNDSELQVANESVEDAFDDIVNYAILGKAMLIEEREKQKALLVDEADTTDKYPFIK